MTALAKVATARGPTDPPVVVETDDNAYIRLGFLTLAITFGLLLGWAAIAPLQSAVVASGRLVAASQNRVVQHPDGGQVVEILVADGDRVEVGQVLLRLDARPLHVRLQNADRQLFELQAKLERLTAERGKKQQLIFSDALLAGAGSDFGREILDTQQALFDSRHQTLLSEKVMLEKRFRQVTTQIVGLNRTVWSMRERATMLRKDYTELEKPNSGKLVPMTRVRELKRRQMELGGEIAESEAEVARLRESIAKNSQQMMLRQRVYQREIATTLRDLQAELISLEARRQVISGKLARVEITAPAAGKIKGLDIVTTGAVISAGEPVMEIVPPEPGYRIHARVSPMDVDALHPGMQAEVRLPAFDGARDFPVIYAGLEDVSADAFTGDSQELAYHKATLALRHEGLDVLDSEGGRLIPGMPVEVYVKTGERTFLDYLARPMQDLLARALNEA